MDQRKGIVIGVTVGLLLVGACLVILRERPHGEPSYDGRTLSSWLPEFGEYGTDLDSPPAIAVRSMGTNAIPYLLDILAYEESAFKKRLRDLEERAPLRSSFFARNYMHQVEAAYALNVLGPAAEPAYPTLTNLLHNNRCRVVADIALAGLGPKGVAPLLEAVTNQQLRIRYPALNALGYSRTDTDVVVAQLIDLLHHDESLMRTGAANSLALLRQKPEIVVPQLIEALKNSGPQERGSIIIALGEFGRASSNAVDVLKQFLNDADAVTAGLAEQAIEAISKTSSSDR